MSKKGKLLRRLLAKPKDLSFNELASLLKHFGYEEFKKGKTSGSRRAFVNRDSKHIIRLHKPHPKNILKMYQINDVIDELSKQNLL